MTHADLIHCSSFISACPCHRSESLVFPLLFLYTPDQSFQTNIFFQLLLKFTCKVLVFLSLKHRQTNNKDFFFKKKEERNHGILTPKFNLNL